MIRVDGGFKTTLGLLCGGGVTSPPGKASRCSAAAQFGQEERHGEEDPHHQQAGAECQQGEGVQEAGVQAQVAHRQQAAQVLLDHALPCPDAAGVTGGRRCGGGEGGQQIKMETIRETGGEEVNRWRATHAGAHDGKQNPRGDITTAMFSS